MSDELSGKAMDEWSSVCNTFTKPHIPPLDDFLDDVESFPGETFADKLKAHAEAFLGLPHIPETPLTKEWLKTIAEKFDYEDYNSQWWTEMFLDRFIDAIVQALHHITEPEQTDPGSQPETVLEWVQNLGSKWQAACVGDTSFVIGHYNESTLIRLEIAIPVETDDAAKSLAQRLQSVLDLS